MSEFDKGKKAYEDGFKSNTNPHKQFTLEYNQWFTGYYYAYYGESMYD